jgi:MFS family permease
MVASVYFFLAGFNFASWASRIPEIQQQLRLSEAELGYILFALPLGLVISLPLAGRLISLYGCKTISALGIGLYSVLLSVIGFATTGTELAIILFLFGAIANIENIAVNTQAILVEQLYSKSIMASFHGVWSVSGFCGAGIGALVIQQQISPMHHFFGVTIFSVLVTLVAYFFTINDATATTEKAPLLVLPDKYLLLIGFIAMCCMICEGTMFDWSGVYFKKVVQAPDNLVAIGYVSFMCCMALGRFVSDAIVQKIGIVYTLIVSGVLIVIGLMLSVLMPTMVVAAIGFMLVGFGVSSVVPLLYGLAGKYSKMSPSLALTAVSTIGYLGFLFGPPLIGFIAAASSLKISFMVIAALGACVALLAKKV